MHKEASATKICQRLLIECAGSFQVSQNSARHHVQFAMRHRQDLSAGMCPL